MAPASIVGVAGDSGNQAVKLDALAMAAAEGLYYLALAAGGGSRSVGGAFCWYSNAYAPAFNGAGIFTDASVEPANIAEIERFLQSGGRPYSLVTLDGLAEDALPVLHSLGYIQYDHSPAMWLDGLPLRLKPALPGLRVAQVRTPADLRTFRAIISRVFAIPPAEAASILNDGVLEIENVHHYVAWLGETPVATASMVLSGKLPGIWNVGTVPEYRRMGVSAGLMHTIVSEAVDLGYTSNMLLASPDGEPMYKRLGYKEISTLRMHAPPRQPGF